MPIVRPRRPACAAARAHSCSASRRSASSCSRAVGESSVERRLARLATATRSSVEPVGRRGSARARSRSRPWFAPKRSAQRASSGARSSPSVRDAQRASRSAVFGPMPGTSAGERAGEARARVLARRARRSRRASRRREAILATSLFGPMPTEAVMPGRLADVGDQPAHRGARLARARRGRGRPRRCPTCSTRSRCARTMSQTAARLRAVGGRSRAG